MDWGSIPGWIEAVAGVVTAGVALQLGLRTFRQQRTATDLQLANDIFKEINRYWDRITDSGNPPPAGTYRYNIGQILAQFELAATLFNKKKLSNDALPVLKDHIVEVLTSLQASEEGRDFIEACRSSPETFKELRTFAKEHMPTALLALAFRDNPQ